MDVLTVIMAMVATAALVTAVAIVVLLVAYTRAQHTVEDDRVMVQASLESTLHKLQALEAIAQPAPGPGQQVVATDYDMEWADNAQDLQDYMNDAAANGYAFQQAWLDPNNGGNTGLWVLMSRPAQGPRIMRAPITQARASDGTQGTQGLQLDGVGHE